MTSSKLHPYQRTSCLIQNEADVPSFKLILNMIQSRTTQSETICITKLCVSWMYPPYPGIQKTTTMITQEKIADQAIGYFKLLLSHENLNGSLSILVWSNWPRNWINHYYQIWNCPFNRKSKSAWWASVEAALLARKYLESEKVWHNSEVSSSFMCPILWFLLFLLCTCVSTFCSIEWVCWAHQISMISVHQPIK